MGCIRKCTPECHKKSARFHKILSVFVSYFFNHQTNLMITKQYMLRICIIKFQMCASCNVTDIEMTTCLSRNNTQPPLMGPITLICSRNSCIHNNNNNNNNNKGEEEQEEEGRRRRRRRRIPTRWQLSLVPITYFQLH
jgi:hypothetical protein